MTTKFEKFKMSPAFDAYFTFILHTQQSNLLNLLTLPNRVMPCMVYPQKLGEMLRITKFLKNLYPYVAKIGKWSA